jgi:hypothetical protein
MKSNEPLVLKQKDRPKAELPVHAGGFSFGLSLSRRGDAADNPRALPRSRNMD